MTKRPYNHRWQKARDRFLKENPICVFCDKMGKVTASRVVDHIEPHKGDRALFWDESNWQALCTEHHQSSKQGDENRGYSLETGNDGWPVDDRHPVNRG